MVHIHNIDAHHRCCFVHAHYSAFNDRAETIFDVGKHVSLHKLCSKLKALYMCVFRDGTIVYHKQYATSVTHLQSKY